jgi:hypothetical protein
MKLLFSFFRHYTEVRFPALASLYNWPVSGEREIKVILCNHLSITTYPTHPSRAVIPRQDMQRLVSLCKEIEKDPSLFASLQEPINT